MNETQQTPNQPVEPQGQAPVETNMKSGKGWLLWVLLILVAGYGAIAYWQNMWPF